MLRNFSWHCFHLFFSLQIFFFKLLFSFGKELYIYIWYGDICTRCFLCHIFSLRFPSFHTMILIWLFCYVTFLFCLFAVADSIITSVELHDIPTIRKTKKLKKRNVSHRFLSKVVSPAVIIFFFFYGYYNYWSLL